MWPWVDWLTGGGGFTSPRLDSPLWFGIIVVVVFKVVWEIYQYRRN